MRTIFLPISRCALSAFPASRLAWRVAANQPLSAFSAGLQVFTERKPFMRRISFPLLTALLVVTCVAPRISRGDEDLDIAKNVGTVRRVGARCRRQ